MHTRRIVSRPAAPGGKVSPAATGTIDSLRPATVRASDGAKVGQAVSRSASSSSSDTEPSPSVSIRSFSWNVGISAWSMTTSRITRSGSTRIPA